MKIAVCQMAAGDTGRSQRIDRISEAVARAAASGARVVVFPELAISGYGAGEAIISGADVAGGRDERDLSNLSKAHGLAIACGLALSDEEGVANSAVFIKPDGSSVRYDKRHLYGDYEQGLFRHGRDLPEIIEFEGLKIGLLVCFDVEFPERVRELALCGVNLVLVPTALPVSDAGPFIAGSVIPVRAFENQVFVAYANHCGRDAAFSYQGLSCVAAPDGSLLSQAGQAPDLIFAEVDPAAYEASRVQNPYLEEVRRVGAMAASDG